MATGKLETGEKDRLLGEFASHTYAEWKEAAEQLLKGRPFDKTLITPTYEGFSLEPIYTREVMDRLMHLSDLPGQGSGVRGSRLSGYLERGWLVSQELTAPTAEELNKIALKELENGQDELNIWLDKPSRGGLDADMAPAGEVGMCGMSLATTADLQSLLEGVHTDMISLYLRSGAAAPAVYALLLAALAEAGADASKLRGCLGMDPAGWLVESGTLPGGEAEVFDLMADLVRHAAAMMPQLQVIDVQGHGYHDAGASSAQEMAAVLSTGVACLKALTERGIPAGQAAASMRLSVSVGGNYFIEMAKLRALRLLWNRVLEAFGVEAGARKIHIHARTGLFNKTVFDPYVNMLRTTTEAFSAVVGGCDSLHVSPFDEVVRESDAFSRRIARNTHAVLGEECGLMKVVDPAGGSWAVESLTDQMAGQAWKLFQQIEAQGGIFAVLTSGDLQQEVEKVRQDKVRNIQRRKDVIVGTNAYPNATEELLKPAATDYAAARKGRLEALSGWRSGRDAATLKAALGRIPDSGSGRIDALIQAAAAGATLGELFTAVTSGSSPVSAEPLRVKRAAEDFEKLRFAAIGLKAAGKPACIHQLNMGPSRRYRIRADWTSAFFQVSGIKVLNHDDYAAADEALAALRESGARVAVITSDDETYAATVEPLAAAIKELDPGITVLVAGAPGDSEDAWRTAGVDDFVNVRVNNYAFNRGLLEKLGAQL
jgi:methylmalonyl-CoA mutase